MTDAATHAANLAGYLDELRDTTNDADLRARDIETTPIRGGGWMVAWDADDTGIDPAAIWGGEVRLALGLDPAGQTDLALTGDGEVAWALTADHPRFGVSRVRVRMLDIDPAAR